MVDYTIHVLDESDLTITGAQLDGVTQGDGSHMVGATMTINANAWTPIEVTDNDNNFQDSDSSQTLNGAQEIDGVVYADGAVVEAEYQLTITDGTDTWTIIGFNVNNSSPAYGTVEGIAVVGGTGGFPPVGVPLTVVSNTEGPNFVATSYASPICFTYGTLIDTPNGPRRIETLRPGDFVNTLDHGAQPVRWIGQRDVAAEGPFAPVLIKSGTFGTTRDLVVSQRHRILIEDWRAQYYFGEDRVLAAAIHLVNNKDVLLCRGGTVTYVHLLFDQHEAICAEGNWSESLHPGQIALNTLERAARDEVLALFPELSHPSWERPLVAHELKRHEVLLVA